MLPGGSKPARYATSGVPGVAAPISPRTARSKATRRALRVAWRTRERCNSLATARSARRSRAPAMSPECATMSTGTTPGTPGREQHGARWKLGHSTRKRSRQWGQTWVRGRTMATPRESVHAPQSTSHPRFETPQPCTSGRHQAARRRAPRGRGVTRVARASVLTSLAEAPASAPRAGAAISPLPVSAPPKAASPAVGTQSHAAA